MAYINSTRSFLRPRLYVRRSLVRLLWLTVFNLAIYYTGTASAMAANDGYSLTTIEILQNNGYTAEAHNVTTKDGYILEVHRISKSKSGQEPTRNHPVLVQHGILGSSADWVLGGAEKSLPMQLADDGYDVWLSNSRGNIYSRKHVSLTYKQRAFWNFCLHELGMYDLPAVIDYILLKTETSQLHYVGFSMGTSIFFIMASEKPEYQSKIRSQISLAPVAYLYNTRSILRYVAPYAKLLNAIIQKTSNGMFMQRSKMEKYILEMMCKEKLTQKLICEKCIIFSVCGSDPYYFDKTLIPLIFGHFPAGTSSKLTAHFAQFMLKESFCQYDYGEALNKLHYNSTEPPVYDLKSIQVPITLIYGKNDILSDTEDVMKLKRQLPRLVDAVAVDNPYCNHVDLMWSVNVTGEVNDPVRASLRRTDRADWTYPVESVERQWADDDDDGDGGDDHDVAATGPGRRPAVAGNDSLSRYLDDVAGNLDAIVASAMPRSVDCGDRETFDRQRELQTALYGNAIDRLRSAEAAWRGWTAGVDRYWTDAVSDARRAAATRAEAVRLGVASAGESARASAARAEDAVSVGVRRAEDAVADGVRLAERAVAGGVARAEKSVAAGVARAEALVRGGLHKTDRAVGDAVNAAVRRLNKAFWFFK